MSGTRAGAVLLLVLVLVLGASAKVFFFEPFDESFGTKWSQSEDPSYEGNWKYQKSEGSEDFGLFIPDKAKKYGIATLLPEAVPLNNGPVVLQYDVRLQKGYDCGGAYIKFLMPQPEGWKASQLVDSTPYSVMFGPDKCGATNKVHFIFRSKDPKTGEHVEHHLENAPAPKTEWVSHVYTAVIHPANNSVKILIDDAEVASADLMSYEDFKPPVLQPKTIKDPEDKKPEDWDERPTIPDPAATKPEDWDEDAPREIPDEAAKKPEGWLDDEPLEVDDPEASKPDDWDDEEDGEWEPPKAPNPKCEEAPGCGEWKRPMKKNPEYKGKWKAPMIDNPEYKGKWTARDIPNPEFVELETPGLEPIAALGIEIWTMTNEVIFDNILICDSEEEAQEYRNKYWATKFAIEERLQKEKAAKEAEKRKENEPKASFKEKVFGQLHKLADLKFLESISAELHNLLIKGEEYEYLVYAILVGVVVLLPLLLLVCLIPRGRKPLPAPTPVEVAKKEDITEPDDVQKEEEEEKDVDKEKKEEGEPAKSQRTGQTGTTAATEIGEEVDKVRRRTRRDA